MNELFSRKNIRSFKSASGDSMELKPISTRKLRRRANEPGSGNGSYGNDQKRRKPLQLSGISYLLEDSDILDDLKIINKNKAYSVSAYYE